MTAALERSAGVIVAVSLAFVAAHVLYVAGRPVATNDAWFHLKVGEVYASEGPWPSGDPMLHTAHEDAPVQHSWLFGVLLHLIERTVGLQGLRVAHVLAVIGIAGLAASLFRRRAPPVAAGFAAVVFLVLSWWRLFQLRPDLFSIPATLLVYRLVIESGERPSWTRVGLAAALLCVWANVHSLFAIGLALVATALAGHAGRALLARWIPGPERASPQAQAGVASRLGVALAVCTLATLLNPRGGAQLLTFFTSSRTTAIWAVSDEWNHFDPLRADVYGAAVSPLAWLATDLLLAALVLVAAIGLWHFARRPSARGLRTIDPVLLALAAASVVAIFVSVRFLWMSVFPLIFLLHAGSLWLEEKGASARRAAGFALATCATLLAVAFPRAENFGRMTAGIVSGWNRYLATPFDGSKYHLAGVRFLRESGVEGNLYNSYGMGGFLGYALAPRLRTFIDGRTEHYSPDVLRDALLVDRQGTRPGETFLDVLDRRRVDLFFGIGVPKRRGPVEAGFTSAHLEGVPGWILVSRSMRHAIYLRTTPRNASNLERIADYYAAARVPFDRARGLDVGAVIEQRPQWAIAHGLLPPGHRRLRAASRSADPEVRFRALEALGVVYTAVGAHREGVTVDREAIGLRPTAQGPRRRLVYGLLRLGRAGEALSEARSLRALDPADDSLAVFERVARQAARGGGGPGGVNPATRNAAINRLPVLTDADLEALVWNGVG